MSTIISIKELTKTYPGGLEALKSVSLDIRRGEIFSLLGPNGAGKTTLISIVCGIVNPTSGQVLVDGHNIIDDFRLTRAKIGLVPQEIPAESFETVVNTVRFSRGLFGQAPNHDHVERVLRSLSLWDRRDTPVMTLSGGLKRRVLIAKALAHEPEVLFLDEPTAGVDVELRKDMWNIVRELRERGVTVILTTHYIEEAEQLADRVGVINNGELIIVQRKDRLMREMGRKHLTLYLYEPLTEMPGRLRQHGLKLSEDGSELVYEYDTKSEHTGITAMLADLREAGVRFNDLQTKQSSLEEIFVDLVRTER